MGMITGNKSCDSKVGKSMVVKQKKNERHRGNVEYRASLHKEKANSQDRRNAAQCQIDEISKRG